MELSLSGQVETICVTMTSVYWKPTPRALVKHPGALELFGPDTQPGQLAHEDALVAGEKL